MSDRHPKLKRGEKVVETHSKSSTVDSNHVYTKAIAFEEREALSRDGEEDFKMYKELCDSFRKVIMDVYKHKMDSGAQKTEEIENLRIDGSVAFVKMKKLNRLEKLRLNSAREKLHEKKRQVDALHLQWQNLLYETHHLKKEVTKCLGFKSKDESIELIPLEEFYETAPHSISRQEITKSDPHQLRVARLEWELKQRKMLAENYLELQEEKEKITNEIKKKRDRIENLVPMIKDILACTKPVQEHLSLPLSQVQSEPELAQLLPPPLYFLSIQFDAMREACDSLIKISITGDKQAAVRWMSINPDQIIVEDSESEEENSQVHHHRRKNKTQVRDDKKKKILMRHPLSVNLQISLKDGRSINILFRHMTYLRIVTVTPSITAPEFEASLSCRHLTDPQNLLKGLFKNDSGDTSPNIANHYLLQKFGIEFSTHEFGMPYMWAQKLCGLDLTGRMFNFAVDPKVDNEQRNVALTVKKIRSHLKMLLDMCEQMSSLDKCRIPEKYSELRSSVKISNTLCKWKLLFWEDFQTLRHASELTEKLNLNSQDSYFEAIFSRDTAKLFATVVISPDYPNTVPMFLLRVEHNEKQYDAFNCNNMRDLEREVNYYVDELFEILGDEKNWILTAQLHRLSICFDIFLECSDPENFSREKLFLNHVQGRTRRFPYKYSFVGSEGLFVQR